MDKVPGWGTKYFVAHSDQVISYLRTHFLPQICNLTVPPKNPSSTHVFVIIITYGT